MPVFGVLNFLQIGAGSLLGAIVVFGAMSLYDAIIDDPAVQANTRRIVEAEADQRTTEAIHAVTDLAERARAMRRYCAERGLLYDFGTQKCRK